MKLLKTTALSAMSALVATLAAQAAVEDPPVEMDTQITVYKLNQRISRVAYKITDADAPLSAIQDNSFPRVQNGSAYIVVETEQPIDRSAPPTVTRTATIAYDAKAKVYSIYMDGEAGNVTLTLDGVANRVIGGFYMQTLTNSQGDSVQFLPNSETEVANGLFDVHAAVNAQGKVTSAMLGSVTGWGTVFNGGEVPSHTTWYTVTGNMQPVAAKNANTLGKGVQFVKDRLRGYTEVAAPPVDEM